MSETPSHFVAVCPNCLVSLKVRLTYSGSHVRCKHCEHKFRAFAPDHLVTPSSEEYQVGPLNTPGSEVERIDVICPNCSASLRVRSELAGQHVRCKQCDHKFLVQKIEEVPAQIRHEDSESDLLERLCGQPGGPQSAAVEPRRTDQQPELTGELAAIREENERLGSRLETLQQDHADIQSERDSLLAQLEQFRGDHDRIQSEREQGRQEYQQVRDELASIRDALGGLSPDEIPALRAERQSLGDENQRLRDQVQSLQTELSSGRGLAQEENDRLGARLNTLHQDHADIQSERDSLLAQLEQFRGDHDRIQSEREQGRQEHQQVRDELASIRDALGGLSPDEIPALRAERQSLGDENQRLRDQVQSLQTELSSSRGLAQLVADREEETRLARLQAEELNQRIKQLDDRLNGVHGERDQLGEQLRDLQAQLSNMELQRDELNERVADHAQALSASQVRNDELAEQLRQRDNELATKVEELERLTSLRQTDAAESEGVRGTLARREQELQQESEELRGQIDELHRTLASAEQAHGNERNRLDEQLHLAWEELASARSEIGALQSRLSELLDRHEQLKADQLEAIEAQRAGLRAEFQAELEAERSRHAEQAAELHARTEADAQLVERLKAEILTIAQSRSAPDSDLAAAREEIADLRAKLADTEITKRSMSSLLEGMGIRLH